MAALVSAHANAPWLVRRGARRVDALQVLESALGLRVATPRILAHLHSSGCEIHLWTIDDPDRMAELLALGVDGLVTDRTDLARRRRRVPPGPGAALLTTAEIRSHLTVLWQGGHRRTTPR
ncbi:glycerophosphodiester phosphodiesterase family protein [Rathayibacter oskolensis]|uniref:glycerophosphodiester phosphodiesterase family protein n=1 Tax=Rathayibacter oskolensis TaxID=1891671 RepID=UPI00265E1ED1|nr:glycerophosphodiester phosphodiesterase family protein [Rathayibacter oskolensis]WKK71292.1 glycerophosphodiester phosphodiesterase family protein [Rathayibacter oskolensis]